MLRTTRRTVHAALNVFVLLALVAGLLAPAMALAQEDEIQNQGETGTTEVQPASEPHPAEEGPPADTGPAEVIPTDPPDVISEDTGAEEVQEELPPVQDDPVVPPGEDGAGDQQGETAPSMSLFSLDDDDDEATEVYLTANLCDEAGCEAGIAYGYDGAIVSWHLAPAGSDPYGPEGITTGADSFGGIAIGHTYLRPGTWTICIDGYVVHPDRGPVSSLNGADAICDEYTVHGELDVPNGWWEDFYWNLLMPTGEDEVPTEEPEQKQPLTIEGFTVDIADACAFIGGGNTLTGTIFLSRDPLNDTDYVSIEAYWPTTGLFGDVAWGRGFYPEQGAMYYEMPIGVNGPWSITMPAYDPVVQGNVWGSNRPSDATALVISVVAGVYPKMHLGGTVYDTTEVVYPLTDCGLDPEPSPTDPPVTPETPVVTETPPPPVVTETPTTEPTAPATETPVVNGAAVPVSLALCANDACTPPYRTDADGFTATWDFTRVAESQRAIRSFFQAETETVTVTAVIQNGTATATSPTLAAGTWNVCLQPVLTRADGATIRLFDAPRCDTVTITSDGQVAAVRTTLPASAPLAIEGEPVGTSPTETPAGTDATPGEDSTPPTGTTGGGATNDAAASATTQSTTGLPVTGTGPRDTTTPIQGALLLLAAATFLAGTGVLLRRRA